METVTDGDRNIWRQGQMETVTDGDRVRWRQ